MLAADYMEGASDDDDDELVRAGRAMQAAACWQACNAKVNVLPVPAVGFDADHVASLYIVAPYQERTGPAAVNHCSHLPSSPVGTAASSDRLPGRCAAPRPRRARRREGRAARE